MHPKSLLSPIFLIQYPVKMRNWRVAVIGRTGRGNYGHNLDLVWKLFPNVQIVAVAVAGALSYLEKPMALYQSQLTGGRVHFPLKNRDHPLAR